MDERRQQQLAKKRWQLLINVFLKKTKNIDANEIVSVRRFLSYGLVTTKEEEREGDDVWYSYACPKFPEFSALIRHLGFTFELEDVLGFNNTGNVCVWPAEEVLAYHCLQNIKYFRDKSVCELGGGMTCLSGMVLALCSEAREILMTDGNDKSIQNVDVIIAKNKNNLNAAKVHARELRWGEFDKWQDLKEAFDCVICADCLFFDDCREALVDTLQYILKPKGEVIIFAPLRGRTFHQFEEVAMKYFDVETVERYDDMIWRLHQQNVVRGIDAYDEDIHYPLYMKLSKV